MGRRPLVAASCALAIAAAGAGEPDARLLVQPGHRIPFPTRIFGCSLPAPGSPGARLFLPELVRNGSFERPALRGPLPTPPGWMPSEGWELRACGGRMVIVRTSQESDQPLVLVGKRKWRDYHLSLLARKTGGTGGLRILFEVQDQKNHVRWTLGARGNTRHILESVGAGRARPMARPVVGRIETGRLYRIDISLRRGTLLCSLDGRLVHRVGKAMKPFAGIGLGAAGATAEFLAIEAERPGGGEPLFLLDDPAKAPLDQLADGWQAVRPEGCRVRFLWDHLYPFNGRFSQRIKVEKVGGGIAQSGIPIRQGTTLVGQVHLRGKGAPPVWVELRSPDGKVAARAALGRPGETWRNHLFRLRPALSTSDATLMIALEGTGTVWVDGVSLLPEGERAWMRSGFLESLRRLGPTLLRWPAGPGALDYEWRRGVGPRAERPPRAALAAEGGRFFPAPNDFGTDEFVALCREVGVEAMLVASPAASASSVADWLDYCNGEPTSRMGQVRASNGHQRPHQVGLWMVAAGDEGQGDGGGKAIVNALLASAPRLRVFAPPKAATKGTGVWFGLRLRRRDLARQLGGLAERLKAARTKDLAPALFNIEAQTAVEAAAALVALASQGAPGALATVPLVGRQQVVGLLRLEGRRASETPLGKASSRPHSRRTARGEDDGGRSRVGFGRPRRPPGGSLGGQRGREAPEPGRFRPATRRGARERAQVDGRRGEGGAEADRAGRGRAASLGPSASLGQRPDRPD